MPIYYTQPDGQGDRVVVQNGRCWNGKPVNRMSEAERNALGLYSPPAPPEPTPPTEAELAAQLLAETDLEGFRVLEDLVNLLENKGVISRTELPQQAQDKIAARALARTKL